MNDMWKGDYNDISKGDNGDRHVIVYLFYSISPANVLTGDWSKRDGNVWDSRIDHRT